MTRLHLLALLCMLPASTFAQEEAPAGLIPRIFAHFRAQPALREEEEEGKETEDDKETHIEEPAESWLGGSAAVRWHSKYISSGIDELPGSSVLTTELTLSAFDFTLGVSGSFGLSEKFEEWDYLLDYTHAFGPVEVSLGYIYITLPRQDLAFHNGYIGASLPKIPWVQPALELAFDLERLNGGFLEFSLHSSLPLVADVVSIEPYVAGALAYNYSSKVSDGLDDTQLRFGVKIPVVLVEGVTLTARAEHIVSRELRDETWFQVELAWHF